jgi:organic hydroperoxide reductase OsmC/OhrA
MSQMTAHVRTLHDASTALGWAGPHTLTIDRTTQAGGLGLGFNGGELLFLAIAGCYCNDIFREADKRHIKVKSVDVDVQGDWDGNPVVAQNITFSVRIEAGASADDIRALAEYTDRVAEIPNSLRFGTPVTLAQVEAVESPA